MKNTQFRILQNAWFIDYLLKGDRSTFAMLLVEMESIKRRGIIAYMHLMPYKEPFKN